MSIASQLQVIKSVIRGKDDPIRRPITRPSILFGPKEAADIDLRSILPLAQSGIETLVEADDRFLSFKSTLFSHASLDIEREKMAPTEEEKLNKSICSYLRLLAGYLHLHAALRTLEYLIRRYQVHVFNIEELVLCALPYHDTHHFVRIVQLIDFGKNKKWAFLDGVKASGASPPRKVIVQQCIRDKGVLEALCSYAAPSKDFQHSRPVTCFCTAVIVEALGSIPKLDTETVQRVLTFVFNGLNPAIHGSRDQKAGALMVVGLVASRATLASKLVQNLIYFIARSTQVDAKMSADLPWLRVTIMALVTLVQSQSPQIFPKKTLMIFKETRDFVGLLSGLSQEFNVQKFLHHYLESLINYSSSDDSCHRLLVDAIEALPIKEFVSKIVHKILAYCVKIMRTDGLKSFEAGNRAKQVLVVLETHYPSELHGSFRKFLENSNLEKGGEESALVIFCRMLDGNSDIAMEVSDSKVWFSLEHPKAAVRQAALLELASSDIMKCIVANPGRLVNLKDALVRRFQDDDLGVVRAALSLSGLSEIIGPRFLFKNYCVVLKRCMEMLIEGTTVQSQACDVAVFCLDHIVSDVSLHQLHNVKEVASIIFPLLLLLPKTWRVNVKALELVNKFQWPFYFNIIACSLDFVEQKWKRLDDGTSTDINLRTVQSLAEIFVANPEDHIEWLVACSRCNKLAKGLLFFLILQSLAICKEEIFMLFKLYKACSQVLKDEWHEMLSVGDGFLAEKSFKDTWDEGESQGSVLIAEELNMERFDKYFRQLTNQLLHTDADKLSNQILVSIFWCLFEILSGAARNRKLMGDCEQVEVLNELFLLFAASSSICVFKKQLPLLLRNCCKDPFQFLSKYFLEEGFSVEVEVVSLTSFANLCSIYQRDRNLGEVRSHMPLLQFPCLLVPLTSDEKEIRNAAVKCVKGIYRLWQSYDIFRLKNGNDSVLLQCASSPRFGDFLELMIGQRRLILSDVDFLSSFLSSLLSPSCDNNLLVPDDIHKRFDETAKDLLLQYILNSACKFPSYGKVKVLALLRALGNVVLRMECCKELLVGLLGRREDYYTGIKFAHQGLSQSEIGMLCLLLEFCVPQSCSSRIDAFGEDCLLKALKVDGLTLDELAVVKPCVTVLENLKYIYDYLDSNTQDQIFVNLVFLFRCENGDIRDAARDALLNFTVSCSTIVRFIKEVIIEDPPIGSSRKSKRNKPFTSQGFGSFRNSFDRKEKIIFVLCSILDILLLKEDMDNRISLVQPLFEVLGKLFSDDWLQGVSNSSKVEGETVFEISESLSASLYHARQSTLLILKNITDSPLTDKVDLSTKLNFDLLVECAHSAMDAATRNHIFLLISSIAKISFGWLSEHIVDLFVLVGDSAMQLVDSYSQNVLENLISTLLPCWLAKANSVGKLFQIFIEVLPNISEHQRLALIVYLLRQLGEKDSLGILFYHLFHSLNLRLDQSSSLHESSSLSSLILKEWEYTFALQLCHQYSSKIWLPSLVMLLKEIKLFSEGQQLFHDLYLAMQFTFDKLRDTELVFECEFGKDADYIQATLGSLLEQVVLHLQLLGVRCRQLRLSKVIVKDLRNLIDHVLSVQILWIEPDSFFKCIVRLLGSFDGDVVKKALGLLCETVKDHGLGQKRGKERGKTKRKASVFPLQITADLMPSFSELCSKINQLISSSSTDSSVKLAAISSIEVLAIEFTCDGPIFAASLNFVVEELGSSDLLLSSSCIRSAAALVSVLGSQALEQLPFIMRHVFEKVHDVSGCFSRKSKLWTEGTEIYQVPIFLSVFAALEIIISNLGGFLNPYLKDILDVVILHHNCILQLEAKLKSKAANVRKLLTEKVPVRLILPPLMKVYGDALKCGESSLCLVFELLADMIGGMDRSSVGYYHVKIYEQCLASLDLRCHVPESVKDVVLVEQSVIHAMVALTMKLTETMFRPLFLHTLEWAESPIDGSGSTGNKGIDRTISFYSLVNKLLHQHKSLFVPYFKYLLESCTRYLTEDISLNSIALTKKRKKARFGDSNVHVEASIALSSKLWHLKALILKSLYQCFLYETIEGKFLDASNFQVLLKPIVSQLTSEPPSAIDDYPDLPTVKEVDELVVLCLGQMAVSARSDVLWKPLNHEVLMQTRSEKVRPKILGLRVIKYLVEHLKEEYLVFLPESIPFLGELLEDVEIPVKSLAQEILKEMEDLSGESLKEYL